MPDLESTMQWKVDIADLKASMAEAKRSISLANAEFKTATAGLDKWSKSADGLRAKLDQLNKILPQQRQILASMEAQYKAIAEAEGEDSAAAQRMAIQVENQRAAVARTEADIKKYNAQLHDMEQETKTATPEVDKLKDALKKAGTVAAEAAAAGLAAFSAAVAATVGYLAKASVEAAAFADDMITLSKVTGISTDDLQAYSYAADLVDVSLDTLTGAMTRNVRSMSSAAGGTGAAADAYKALGISVTDANGELRDSEEVFWEAIDALGAISNETERDALAMDLFGKSARDLNPLIMEGSEGMQKLTEEARDMGAVLSDVQLADLGAFDDSIRRLQAGAAAGKRALGLVFLPALQSLATDGVDLIGQFTRGVLEADGDWDAIAQVVGDTVGGFAGIVTQQIPKLMTLGTSILQALTKAIIDALPTLAAALTDALPVIIEGFSSMLPQLLSMGGEVIVQLLLGIANAMPQLIEMLPGIIITIVKTLLEYLPQIIDAGVQILKALISGIGSVLGDLWSKVQEIAGGIIERIRGAVSNMVSIGRDLVAGIWEGISGAYGWIKEKITGWVGNVVSFIKNLFGIHSPSQVMADQIGRWLPAGMAEGFEEDMPAALSEMKRTLDGAIGELQEGLSLTMGGLQVSATESGSTGAGSSEVNFTQIINSPKAPDRLTIYRETNSLLFAAKVRMANV